MEGEGGDGAGGDGGHASAAVGGPPLDGRAVDDGEPAVGAVEGEGLEGGFDGAGAGFAAEGRETGAGEGGPLIESVRVGDEDAVAIWGPCGG